MIDFFPTLDTFRRSYLIADLDSVSAYTNLEATGGELASQRGLDDDQRIVVG